MLNQVGNWFCDITPVKDNWKQFSDWRYRLGMFLIHFSRKKNSYSVKCSGCGRQMRVFVLGPDYYCEICSQIAS